MLSVTQLTSYYSRQHKHESQFPITVSCLTCIVYLYNLLLTISLNVHFLLWLLSALWQSSSSCFCISFTYVCAWTSVIVFGLKWICKYLCGMAFQRLVSPAQNRPLWGHRKHCFCTHVSTDGDICNTFFCKSIAYVWNSISIS